MKVYEFDVFMKVGNEEVELVMYEAGNCQEEALSMLETALRNNRLMNKNIKKMEVI